MTPTLRRPANQRVKKALKYDTQNLQKKHFSINNYYIYDLYHLYKSDLNNPAPLIKSNWFLFFQGGGSFLNELLRNR